MIKMKVVRTGILFSFVLCTSFIGQENELSPQAPSNNDFSSAAVEDLSWPRTFTHEKGNLTLYQPQLERWINESFEATAAIGLIPEGKDKALYGFFRVKGSTYTNLESRVVTLYNLKITEIDFKVKKEKKKQELQELVRKIYPTSPRNIALDHLLAALEALEDRQKGVIAPLDSVEMKADPPDIILSTKPAILVLIDGEPVLREIPDTESGLVKKSEALMHVINTRGDILYDPKKENYYLLANRMWYTTKNIAGPWEHTKKIPKNKIKKIPHDHIRARVKSAAEKPDAPGGKPATIYVRTRPTELITTRGKPKFEPIAETDLLYVSNTDGSLFLKMAEKDYFMLIAGRWFKAKVLQGPWEFIMPDKIPDDFSKIRPGHPAGKVLASVSGTPQAREAVLLAKMPQKASIKRKDAKVTVTYDGTPQFKAIEGTSISYAVNTNYDVVKIENKYYCCYQAVWFVATTPNGPWIVCDRVPSVIYSIPSSCPVYHVTYVRVYGSNTSTIVVGYTSGYHGSYYYHGCMVYGTGYYYYPYYSDTVYYGYPYTYGIGVSYQTYRGGYVYGTNYTHAYGTTKVRQGYNPHTGVSGYGYQTTTPYGQWGEGVITKGDQWAHVGYDSKANRTVRGIETSEGTKAIGRETADGRHAALGVKDGDVYAGRDGNVYKRTDEGWQKNEDGEWKNVDSEKMKSELDNKRKDRNQQTNREKTRQNQSDSGGRDRLNLKDSRLDDQARKNREGNFNRAASNNQGRIRTQRSSNRSSSSGWGSSSNRDYLQRSYQSRRSGTERTNNFQSWQRSQSRGGNRSFGSGGRRSFGGRGSLGGGRGGGVRRR